MIKPLHPIDISANCVAISPIQAHPTCVPGDFARSACLQVYILVLSCLSFPALAENPRGQLLYENHCRSCHDTIVHNRQQRKLKSIDDLRYWTVLWSAELELDWGFEEVEAVSLYQNDAFYHFVEHP